MSRSVDTIFLRLKYLCSRYGKLAAVALVIVSSVALAGSAVAYTAPPETTQVTQQTDVQSFTTTVNASAAVTGNTTLYDADDRLSNMPVYLLSASPEMTLRAHADVPDDRAVEVTQQVTMELYATKDEEVFWTETKTLAKDSQQVTDGSLVTETTINVSDIRRGRLTEVQPEVNNVGTLRAKLHVDTVYSSDKYQGHLTVTTPVEITDRAYSVETPQSDEASHATPVTRTLQRSGDSITFGAPAAVNGTTQAGLGAVFGSGPTTVPKASAIQGGIGLGGLLIALAIWRFYRRNPEWQDLKQSYDKARYGEWISLGTVPDGDEYEKVAISGLTDLLDIAIDSNKRIIHDADRALYAVVDNGIVYEYNEALDELDSPEHRYIDVSGEEVPQLGSAGQESFFDQVTDEETSD
jgi:biopolymer transport protein ExbD